MNSKFAPLAGLLLEYIFREGYYDPAKRLPLLVARGGEDTYAVSARTAPGAAECLSFPDKGGDSLAPLWPCVVFKTWPSFTTAATPPAPTTGWAWPWT